jgi:hypothetical protein
MIPHLFLCAWSMCITPSISTDSLDSLSRPVPMNIAMENLAVVPLPMIDGMKPGDTPVDVSFEEALFDPSTSTFIARGLVTDLREKIEIPGARVILGSLDSTKMAGYIFSPRVSVMTNFQGQFKFTAKVKQSDVLLIVWLGYVEKMYTLKKMVTGSGE